MLAKIASELAKPDGLLVVTPGTELDFLHPLDVRRLWGVGPATQRRLDRLGVHTIGDLAAYPAPALERAVGHAHGAHLHALAHNIDERGVEPDRQAKSIGHEETFPTDVTDRARLDQDLVGFAERVATRLRAHAAVARTVQLKARYADFRTVTRSRTLAEPTDLADDLARVGRELPRRAAPRRRAATPRPLRAPAARRRRPPARPPLRRRRRRRLPDPPRRPRTDPRRRAAPLRRRGGSAGGPGRPQPGEPLVTIRIGLVGCGHIGFVHSYTLRQLITHRLVDAEVTATYDTDPSRAEAFATPHHARAAPSLAALLDDVDAVWVCTWTAAHLEAVTAAAARGRAVFCEKPLAPNLPDCERVAAALATVPHQVGLVLRYAPVFQALADRLADPATGRPLAAVFRDDQYFPNQGIYGSDWRSDARRAGGGTLIEHSIHDIDLLTWLLGDPVARLRPGRVALRAPRDRRRRHGHLHLPRRRGRDAGERVAPDPDPRLDPPPRGVLRARAAVARRRPLGPAPRRDVRGGTSTVTADPPAWVGTLDPPPVLARAIAEYAPPTKAFLDALAHGSAAAGAPDAAVGARRAPEWSTPPTVRPPPGKLWHRRRVEGVEGRARMSPVVPPGDRPGPNRPDPRSFVHRHAAF